tara:strand:+ start:10783 stop:11592 length:810 start_codon:yes stop_codon:yes gene_type:complete
MKRLLLIGCGHMGSALLNAWQKFRSYNISVIDPINYKLIKKKYKNKRIQTYNDINKLEDISKFDVVVLAVTPQIIDKILLKIKFLKLKKNSVIISIIAGKKIKFFKDSLSNSRQIIRVMPNMPALIERGVTCMVANKFVSAKNKKLTSNLFSKVGKIFWFPNENYIDMATAVSGSGPGYVFNLINSMEKAAINLGFSKNQSREMVLETFLGALILMRQSGKNSQELIKSIAIKGGTTEAGLKKMNELKIRKLLKNTILAAFKKAKYLGK